MPGVTDEAARIGDEARAAIHAADFFLVERLSRQLVAMGEEQGDRETIALGYYDLGVALWNLNRTVEAMDACRKAIALYEQLGDRFATARAMMNLAAIEIDNNVDVAEARRLFEMAEPIVRELGESLHLAIALGNLSEICRLEGDYRGALRRAEEALPMFEEVGEASHCIWMHIDKAHYYLLLRKPQEAVANLRAAQARLKDNPNPRWIANAYEIWFLLAVHLGKLDVAAQLLGYVDSVRHATNQPRLMAMMPWLSEPKERLARELGERFDELLERGESLSEQGVSEITESLAAGV